MCRAVVSYESVTLCFCSFGYLLDLQDSCGKLYLCMNMDKDYGTSVYELC